LFDAAEIAEDKIMKSVPIINSESIISGMAGVFSGFAKHVSRISNEYKVDARDVYVELGRRRIVGGQEDIIIEVVMDLIRKEK
jgi:4-hydroxy 2-oxovalerate aldolase